MPSVEFHVLSDAAPDAHLRLACRLAEEAVDQGQRVFVRATQPEDQRRIDELLWTFGDRSFLPHEIAGATTPSHPKIRVLIGATPPPDFRDVVINLGLDAPADSDNVGRIAELVPNDAERKAAARERFKYYRARNIEPVTHNL